jgi:hypothetical protein
VSEEIRSKARVVEVTGRRNSRPTRTDTDFGKTTKLAMPMKEKEIGDLARILRKKAKKKRKKEKRYL